MTTLRMPLESINKSLLGMYPAGSYRYASELQHTLKKRHKRGAQFRRRTGDLNILYTFMAAVNTKVDLSTIQTTLKQLMIEQLDIPGGAIFLFDEAPEIPLAHWGISEACLTTVKAAAIDSAQRYSLKTAPDLPQNGTSLRLIRPESTNPKWVSGLCIQVIVSGAIRATLYLFNQKPLVASPERAIFYETLGQQIGVAIQKADLEQQARIHQQKLQQLARRLVEAQETERRNIAHELHDEIGQSLTGLKLLLESADCFASDGSNVDLSNAIDVVRDLLGQVHNLSLDLRPSILDDLGLEPALKWQFRRYMTTTHICVNFEHTPLATRFAPEIETAAYRIVQEALTNVARYAGVKEVDVYVGHDDEQLLIKVEDHGTGFDVERVLCGTLSTGVTGMMERAALLRGTLKIDSTPGTGTSITAKLPLSKKFYGEVYDGEDSLRR